MKRRKKVIKFEDKDTRVTVTIAVDERKDGFIDVRDLAALARNLTRKICTAVMETPGCDYGVESLKIES